VAYLATLAALLLGGIAAILLRLRSLELPQVKPAQNPAPRPGIWFCAHRAKRWITLQHLFLRISPRDPSWAERYPLVFVHKDSMGNPFCTLGAGPFEGRLKLEFNRHYDINDPISFEEPVPFESLEQENGRIATLLASAARYKQGLPFRTLPSSHGYNCNSIISALALRAGLPLPQFSKTFLLCIGTGTPVPDRDFNG
jgi:hypothetical protein